MKIIGSGSSPFVRKDRIVATLKAIEHTFELELQWAPESQVHLLNPLGKVPVLALDDGNVVFESKLIAEYLDSLPSTAQSIYPVDTNARFACKQIEVLADGTADATALAVQENWRSENARSKYWRERQLAKVARGLSALNNALDGRAHFFENRITLADIAAVCTWDFVRVALASEIDWGAFGGLAKLGEALNQLEPFIATKPFRAPGTVFPTL